MKFSIACSNAGLISWLGRRLLVALGDISAHRAVAPLPVNTVPSVTKRVLYLVDSEGCTRAVPSLSMMRTRRACASTTS